MSEEFHETELKLSLPEADLPRLRRHPRVRALTTGRARTFNQQTAYFDTESLALERRGLSLRLRRMGRRYKQTIKSRSNGTGGLFERMEIEFPVTGSEPQIDAIPYPAVRALVQEVVSAEPLRRVFETIVQRTRRTLELDGARIVCDLDVGEIRTESGALPIVELELEVKQGSPGRAFDLAIELQEDIALRPSIDAKADRGYALLDGRRPAPLKARRLRLPENATLDQALSSIFRTCLGQILANEQPAHEGLDIEGVHQMRVGARRLRSALRLFREMLPADQSEPLRAELRWLASELGPARDLDVFVGEIFDPTLPFAEEANPLEALRAELEAMRGEAYMQVRRAIDSPRCARLMLQLGRWVARGAWRDQPLSEESARIFAPARTICAPLLEQLQRKALKLGRRIATRPVEEKHRLRIHLKKLRYASEFLSSLYSSTRSKNFIRRLAGLQDILGHLNDAAMVSRLMATASERAQHDRAAGIQRAAGFVAGWSAAQAQAEIAALETGWKRFRKAQPFWR